MSRGGAHQKSTIDKKKGKGKRNTLCACCVCVDFSWWDWIGFYILHVSFPFFFFPFNPRNKEFLKFRCQLSYIHGYSST